MYTVYCKKYKSNMKELGKASTQDEAFLIIQEYLNSINFKSYYYNMHISEDNTIVVDYGSHTDFCYIKGDSQCRVELEK